MLRNEVTDGPADGLGKVREQWVKGACSLNDTSMIFSLLFLWEKAVKTLYSDRVQRKSNWSSSRAHKSRQVLSKEVVKPITAVFQGHGAFVELSQSFAA